MFNFEKLDAWKIAIEFADEVYGVTRDFPRSELFGLRSQLRRASVSISANLAEGSGRTSNKEFIRFIEIAFGSLMETVSHMEIARRQDFVTADQHQAIYHQSERLGRILSGLRRSLQDE